MESWDEMCVRHGRELSEFAKKQLVDFGRNNTSLQAEYKALVRRHYYDATIFIEREQIAKQEKEWRESVKPEPDFDAKLMETIHRLDEYEHEKDPKLRDKIRERLVAEGILADEKGIKAKVADALDKILRKGKGR